MIKYEWIAHGRYEGNTISVKADVVALHVHDEEAAKELFNELYDECVISDVYVTDRSILIVHDHGVCEFIVVEGL